MLRFGVSAAASGDLPIDAGTVCMTADGVRFATTEDAVLAEGELYVDVPAWRWSRAGREMWPPGR